MKWSNEEDNSDDKGEDQDFFIRTIHHQDTTSGQTMFTKMLFNEDSNEDELMHEVDQGSLSSWTVFGNDSDVDKDEQIFVGTYIHKDPEDVDRAEKEDEPEENVDEPVEQEDNGEDKESPEIISVEVKGIGNMSLNALQFANTMAIVNMMNK